MFYITMSLITGGVVLLLLFFSWDNHYHTRSLIALWDLGHVVLFALLTLAALRYWYYFADLDLIQQATLACGLALLIGCLIEGIQYFVGRDASFHDLGLNLVGVLISLAWSGDNEKVRRSVLYGIRILAVLALIVSLLPLARSLMDEFSARNQFPVLADFRSPWQADRFIGNTEREYVDGTLEVNFTTEKYSGFALRYFPRDWRTYSRLEMEMTLPGTETLGLTCHIHDQLHNDEHTDRYNRHLLVNPGSHTIIFDLEAVRTSPTSRMMNMAQIAELRCFIPQLQSPRKLLLRRISLK